VRTRPDALPELACQPAVSQCLRELPTEFAALSMGGGLPRAYVLTFTVPGEAEATYLLRYDISMKDPPQICRNLADYERRRNQLSPDTRIQCWVPRG